MESFFQQLQNITVILVRPKYAENIGFTARVMHNFALSKLFVIGDQELDREAMQKTATHNAKQIIETLNYFPSLSEALADFHLVVGTTARTGRNRQISVPLRDVSSYISPYYDTHKVALLFGPEDRGLTNSELNLCTAVTRIETGVFSSLNLSHAVGIICQELYFGLKKAYCDKGRDQYMPRLANSREQEEMFSTLLKLCLMLDRRKENSMAPVRLKKFRTLLGRRALQARETRMLTELYHELLDCVSCRKVCNKVGNKV